MAEGPELDPGGWEYTETPPGRGRTPWHRRKRLWVLAAVALALVAGTAGDEPADPADERALTTFSAATALPAGAGQGTSSGAAESDASAGRAIDGEDCAVAALFAAGYEDSARARVQRNLSRAIAGLVLAAVRRGDRSTARRLLAQFGSCAPTPQLAAARARLAAATRRASARRSGERARPLAASPAAAGVGLICNAGSEDGRTVAAPLVTPPRCIIERMSGAQRQSMGFDKATWRDWGSADARARAVLVYNTGYTYRRRITLRAYRLRAGCPGTQRVYTRLDVSLRGQTFTFRPGACPTG